MPSLSAPTPRELNRELCRCAAGERRAPSQPTHPSNTKHISPGLLQLQRKAHRTAEETETAKLLIVLIADYEAKHFTVEKASGVEVLKELMNTNGLRQKDLAEDLGGESIVSLILKEKRQLNRQQMEKLSQRFHVSPAVFF